MKRTPRIDAITDIPRLGLCTSCGGCAGVCPTGAIEMTVSPKGTWWPVVDRTRCTRCGLCLAVCPGHAFDFPTHSRALFGRLPEHPEVGHFEAIYVGWASDDSVRRAGQSGGIVSALLIHLLKTGEIDGAVVTRWSRSDPLMPETVIARTESEVLEAAGSKYCAVPAARALTHVLDTDGRFAFVGTSCQMQAVRKAERVLPKLRKKIHLHLGLFCLNVFNLHFHRHMLARIAVKPGEVKHFTYRSKQWRGWPCDMRIETTDGRVFDLDAEYSRLTPRPFFNPWRCMLCPDKLNEFADISLGDCRIPRHYGGTTLAEVSYGQNPGKSDMVVRTTHGHEVLKRASAAGVLRMEPTGWEELLSSTGSSDKKVGVRPFSVVARAVGRGVPDFGVSWEPASPRHRLLGRLFWPVTLVLSCHFLLSDILSAFPGYRRLLACTPHRVMWWMNRVREKLLNNRRFQRVRLVATYRPEPNPVPPIQPS